METPADKYTLKIERTSPEAAPMQWVADCISEFAKMLGHKADVHLQGIRDNCIALDALVDPKGARGVRHNIASYRADHRRAYDRFDDLLRKQGTYAVLYDQDERVRLEIPGAKIAYQKPMSVRQSTTIKGDLEWIGGGGLDEPSIAHFVAGDGTSYKCRLPRDKAKEVSGQLYETFVVTGDAHWARDKNGHWSVQDYISVKEIERLEGQSLADTLVALRGTMGEWTEVEDIEDLIARIRKDA